VIYGNSLAKTKIDYVVVSKNAAVTMADLNNNYEIKTIIFDGSNGAWKIEKWKKECEELHLQFHAVSQQGAFVTDL
jgi:competence protein ComEC